MWLTAQGQPVQTKPATIQIDIPCETPTDNSAVSFNFIVVFMAVMQLFAALKSGDPAAIAAAIQAFINALMGK
jgi:hypothetical protein